MLDNSSNNKRIAKNTLMLYIRMFFNMAVSLYTSRIILSTLGVDDYGINNVVGGFVAMFSVLSSSLSSAISRFITFELGNGNKQKLKTIFSTAVNIQLAMSVLIIVICEAFGIWFLNNKMTIPSDRLYAANWVLQFSILTFCINLINVPYNAAIIAHEKMSAFAYISIFEVIFKLLIVYALVLTSIDKLIAYSFLLLMITLILRFIYGFYCKRNFEECSYRFIMEKSVLKEMSSFAGWNFFGNTAYILNTQGVNMLMNVFFGVAVNAARGVATQVDSAVRQFINSFTTAVNPQITKSYATGDFAYMQMLICRSSKISAYLMLFFAVPIVLEANEILVIWLNTVPDYAAIFIQLTIFNTFFDCIFANSLVTAMFATGKIKRYQLIMTLCGFSVFPLTWIFFQVGLSPQVAYVIYGLIYLALVFVRLYLLKDLIHMQPIVFIKDVLLPFVPVVLIAFMIPSILLFVMEDGFTRLLVVCVVAVITTALTEYFIGLTKNEKIFVEEKFFKTILSKIKK